MLFRSDCGYIALMAGIAGGAEVIAIPEREVEAAEVAERDLHGKAIHRVSNCSTRTIVSLHLYGVSAERLTTGINRIYA